MHLRTSHWGCEEMENESSLICEHFYQLTAAITQTHWNIKSFDIPMESGLEEGLPPQAFIQPSMTNDHLTRAL